MFCLVAGHVPAAGLNSGTSIRRNVMSLSVGDRVTVTNDDFDADVVWVVTGFEVNLYGTPLVAVRRVDVGGRGTVFYEWEVVPVLL